ncbi:hypothetical protein D3C85_892280 [compost metagenome]
MPEVDHTAAVTKPILEVWDFVKEMDNWAPLLTGYQRHEKINDDESIWFVKGELGGMTRVAEFHVKVTEWAAPDRVTFVMRGLHEPVTGAGEFFAQQLGDGVPAAKAPEQAPGWFVRTQRRVVRWMVERIFGKVPERVEVVDETGPRCSLNFKLAVTAGGATGPVVNLLLTPILRPVVEDLANRIAAGIESRGGQAAVT